MRFFSVGTLSFALALSLGWPVAAHTQTLSGSGANLDPSALFFRIIGPENGTFSIGVETGGNAVTYDLADSEVAFQLFDSDEGGFDNPLFCFDFAAPPQNPQLRLNVSNASGHVALGLINLASALQYNLTGNEIVFLPAASVQCFYVGDGDEPVFGLFGQVPAGPAEPPPEPEGLIFRDRFESDAQAGLSIRFDDLPETMVAGVALQYRLVVENTGDLTLDDIAYQEVFAGNAQVHDAALDSGAWICAGFEGASCPENNGTGAIRVQTLTLQPGQRVEYTISRDVVGATGLSIDLFAGAVNGFGPAAVFDVDQASVVIGND